VAEIDWSLVNEDGFWAAERAALNVSRSFPDVEEDDAYQDAIVYIATHPAEVREVLDYGFAQPGTKGGVRGARKCLAGRLAMRLRERASRRAEVRALERVAAEAALKSNPAPDMGYWGSRPTPQAYAGLSYTPALIEFVLSVMWDEHAWSGVAAPGAPERGMPRAKSDPSHSGNLMAHMADVRRAWGEAGLGQTEAGALFLIAVCRMTERGAADELGISDSTVRRHAESGMNKLATHLNGKEALFDEALAA